jgi:phosphotransferase system enzyme I (PtsI)
MGNAKMRGMAEAVDSVLLVLLQQLSNVTGATLEDAPDGAVPVTPMLPVGMTSYLRGPHGARIHGMINSAGTDEDHTNIVVRALGVGVARVSREELERIENGDIVIIDGPNKKIIFNPETSTLDSYSRKSHADATAQQALLERSQADYGAVRTRNGETVKVSANISYSDEVSSVNAVHAAGIGLYRTELAVQRANSTITEEEWRKIFSDIVTRTEGGKVIIRTVDFDGDKANDTFDQSDVKKIIGRQMNAALRVANEIGHERVGVMIPVVSSAAHLQTFQDTMDKEAARLGVEPINLGAMVETKEFIPDLGNASAAFFSIGTNDLIADIIGFNRFDREERNRLHDPTDPRVLAAIAATAAAGDAKGIPVSVCGDLGSDPRYFALLTGAGIRSVSAGASAVPIMKEVARRIDTVAAKELFNTVIATPDLAERLRLLDAFNARELGLRNRSLDPGWASRSVAGPITPQP